MSQRKEPRPRPKIKWTLSVLAVLVLGAWIASRWYFLVCEQGGIPFEPKCLSILIRRGRLEVCGNLGSILRKPDIFIDGSQTQGLKWGFEWEPPRLNYVGSVIPLWAVFLAFGGPAGRLLVARDSGRAPQTAAGQVSGVRV